MTRKTTRIKVCQLPKNVSASTLKRNGGGPVDEREIVEVIEDIVKNPYLPYAMHLLGMLNETTVNALDGSGEKSVYVVVRKPYGYLDVDSIKDAITRACGECDKDQFNEILTAILGIQYVLYNKEGFEADTVILEGNSIEEIKEARGIVDGDATEA